MTVTELREALQKLEAEGHGALPVIWWDTHHSDLEPCHVEDASVEDAPSKTAHWRLGFKTDATKVVTIR